MAQVEHDPEVHDELAGRVRDAYVDNPRLTTNIVASQLDTTIQDVALVLDEYQVYDDGSVEHVGEGKGGNWVPGNIQDEAFATAEPVHIGYRWPDGSLRGDPFDIENAEHRADQGILDSDA